MQHNKENPTVSAAGTLEWVPADTMKDFRWHWNNVLHKIYIQFYVQFTHFVMMTLTGDWDICYILISTGYTKSINCTSQGLKNHLLWFQFLWALPSRGLLWIADCENLNRKKNPQLSLNLWLSPEFGVEPYASIRLAQKNCTEQCHLWPARRVEFQKCNNAQRFCRLKSLLTRSVAYFQTLLSTSVCAPPILLMLTSLLLSTLNTSVFCLAVPRLFQAFILHALKSAQYFSRHAFLTCTRSRKSQDRVFSLYFGKTPAHFTPNFTQEKSKNWMY